MSGGSPEIFRRYQWEKSEIKQVMQVGLNKCNRKTVQDYNFPVCPVITNICLKFPCKQGSEMNDCSLSLEEEVYFCNATEFCS